MGIIDATRNQFRTIIQWSDPQEWEIFRKFDKRKDEIKNASKLIIQPGQGCIFTYEGTIKGVFNESGIYEIDTDNKPFITTLKKFINFFESDHKTGIWFYRTADIVNIRWGTRIPITYADPVYGFPVNLRAYGNFSINIINPENFFTSIIAARTNYYAYDLQELLLSRISQPISNYLANAKFTYAEVDSNLEKIAADATVKTRSEFESFGFNLLDFRIEGSSFDEETNVRIAGISNIQADVKAAQMAGVSFEELQKMIAKRDAARNQGGVGAGIITAYNLSNTAQPPSSGTPSVKSKLKELKEMRDEGLLDDDEYKLKKDELLKQL
ncbi:SPFH domain-containing protein [Mucilaginibacter sabulilitoris]|uniref:SPFH domain-containing protein n=1 Tax=Mucilaginibacter sabulilitoris TaxID=1173583 RepID=A0ABZ0TZ31_9SPHI|nr:SPFH domain-containing protein [Mucilaginibacter sabulilitoris]WPU96355.1 SPFH domain-containing protein [Mucilaginibacter sabulilitoris]